MAAKSRRFVPFRLLSPSHPEYTRECSAHKNDGKRCTSKVPERAIDEIRELHGRVQESTLDDDAIADILRKLARLTICGRQLRSAGTVEGAVKQWRAELQAEDDGTDRPNTPLGNVKAEVEESEKSPQLTFTPYQTTDVDTLLAREFDQLIDRRISQKFNSREWRDERDHLYVFECEEAKGMCKLGRTKNLSRRASQHDKCYPLLTERWSLYCPNAEVFEKVVQLEFSQRRYQHVCSVCSKTHTEWFKANLEEMVGRLKLWCEFSCHLQTREKRLQLTLPLAGGSPAPDRWYRWAQGWVRTWDEHDSQTAPNTPDGSSVDNAIMIIDDPDIDDDAHSVPGLSPSGSAPGTPDDEYNDPPTPTPVERSWSGKPPLRPRLDIRTVSQSVLDDTYYTPVETMATPKGPVLFPVIPGAFPDSPTKGLPEGGEGDDYGLDSILESIRLLWMF
jgi:hypothetical protein